MQQRSRPTLAIGALALLACATSSSLHAAGSEGSGDGVPFPPLPQVYPASYDLRWTIELPIMSLEQRELAFKVPSVTTRSERRDYRGPVVRTERRKLASYPDFSCKYVDWTVSNDCRTVWRGIYADLPKVVVRPQHVVFDAPDVRTETWTFPVALPHWAWKKERWAVSLPAFAPETSR